MKQDNVMTRREMIRVGGSATVAAGLVHPWSAGHGGPQRKKLALRITNPDEKVIDAHMPTPPTLKNEFPPSVVTVGGRRWLFIGSNHSVVVPIPANTHILKDPECSVRSPEIYTIGGAVHEIRLGRLPVLHKIPADEYWRHTYCGTFNVDVMPKDRKNPEWVFSINHCENKNLSWKTGFTKWFTTNSINPADEATPKTTSGAWGEGGKFMDYQPAYFGLVSMSYAPVTAETQYGAELFHHDMGPIIWPQMGFMTPDGSKKNPAYTNPHSHPSSLIAEDPNDGKTYVYVWANISGIRPGDHNMIGAARSPIESRGLPGTFANYYQGDYTEPSLPANMNQDISILRTLKGGKADPIHPSAQGRINRFFAARLKRSGLFLSVESYNDTDSSAKDYKETALRLSHDLRTWTDRIPVPGTRSYKSYGRMDPPFAFYYPKFLSADGSSHYEIDESKPFYIIGTKPHEVVYRELEIDII
jgi:hypothetical protein